MTNSVAGKPVRFNLLISICAMLVAGLGLAALGGWVLGIPVLAGFLPGRIPMAPSTSALFVLYAFAVFFRCRLPLSRVTYWTGIFVSSAGALISLLLFILSFLEIHPDIEHLGIAILNAPGANIIGHMSPVTALCFLLASISFLSSLLSSTARPRLATPAWLSACLLIAISLSLVLTYLHGIPVFYGRSFIPPALPTGLAFMALGIAMLGLAGPSQRRTNLPHVLSLIIILLSTSIFTAGSLYQKNYERQYRAEVERELTAVAELKASGLVDWRKERLGDGVIFYKNATFTGLVKRYFANPNDPDTMRKIRSWINQVYHAYPYDGVFLLDMQFTKKIMVPEALERETSLVYGVALNVLKSGKITFEDFYWNEKKNRIFLKVLVPVIDEADNNKIIALIEMRIDPKHYLYPYINKWPTHSRTAETMLVRRDNNDVQFLSEHKFMKHAPLEMRIPLEHKDAPSVKAVLGQTGIVEGIDSRDVRIIADIRPVPDSPWFLVTRIDVSEVYAPLREHLWIMAVLMASLFFGAGASLSLFLRQQRIRFLQEQYKAAEALRASEENYRVMAEKMVDVLYITDMNGVITYISPSARQIFGWQEEEMVGRNFTEFLSQDEIPIAMTAFRAASSSGQTTPNLVLTMKRKDGGTFYGELNGSVLFQEDRIAGTHGLIRDITERRKMEKEIIKARNLESLGILAGGIAHDFNNLLQGLLGNISMAKAFTPETSRAFAFLKSAEESYSTARGLTNQLIAFATGGISVRETIQPTDLIREAVSFNLSGSNIKAGFTLNNDLLSIHADTGQLRQLIGNIVLNAREAMPSGGRLTISASNIEIQAGSVPRLEPGQYVLISIADNGPGIPEEILPRIFDPYFSTKDRGSKKGMGLGLTICDAIVKKHNGLITVDTEPGKGATFRIYLPAVVAGAAAKKQAAVASAGKGSRILFMDDEPAVYKIAVDFLEHSGYRADYVADGEAAIEAYKTALQAGDPYAVVILDLTIPGGMGGQEALVKMREMDPGVKAIVSSGYANDPVLIDYASYGFMAGLAKPYKLEVLKAALERIL